MKGETVTGTDKIVIPVEGLGGLLLYCSGTKGLIVNYWIPHGFTRTFKMLYIYYF